MTRVSSWRLTWAGAAISFFVFAGGAAADTGKNQESGRLYRPSEDPMADVDAALEAARENHKLALIIMGANWCHDSRALASRLQEPEMTPIIEDNYVVEFIDVAHLETGMEVIRRFGQPVIYGTPTVLIIDPVFERAINLDSSPRWRNANSIGMDETVEYFTAMAKPAARLMPGQPQSPELAQLLAEIDAWELVQAERLYEAFAVIAPMLKQYEVGNAPGGFEESWDAVAAMRSQITSDLAALRGEAREIAATGSDRSLVFPEYAPFPWEPANSETR